MPHALRIFLGTQQWYTAGKKTFLTGGRRGISKTRTVVPRQWRWQRRLRGQRMRTFRVLRGVSAEFGQRIRQRRVHQCLQVRIDCVLRRVSIFQRDILQLFGGLFLQQAGRLKLLRERLDLYYSYNRTIAPSIGKRNSLAYFTSHIFHLIISTMLSGELSV